MIIDIVPQEISIKNKIQKRGGTEIRIEINLGGSTGVCKSFVELV